MTENDILKTTEAAKLLGVRPRVLRNWVKNRSVPFIAYPGNVIRFNRETLEDFMQFHVIHSGDTDVQNRVSTREADRLAKKLLTKHGINCVWK